MRHRFIWRFAAPALLGGLLWGISGCDSGSTSPTSTITDTGTLATSLAQAFCARAACCAVALSPDDAGGVPSDAAVDAGSDAGTPPSSGACVADGGGVSSSDAGSSCQDRAMVAILQQLALVSTAVQEGLLSLTSSAAATACVTAYQNRPCDGTQTTVPDVQDALAGCSGLFTGYIPAYERCDMTPECIAGSFCLSQGTGQNLSSIAGSSSLGVCFPYEELNEACNTSGDCDPSSGLQCDPVTLTCQTPPHPVDAGS